MSTPLLEQVRPPSPPSTTPRSSDRSPISAWSSRSRSTVRASFALTVLLTVAGCPLKDTITRDVNAALRAVPGVTDVDLTLGVMSRRAACRPEGAAQRRQGAAGDPVRAARLADQGLRDRVRQGRRRQVVGHGQPRAGDGRPGTQGRNRRRRHLRTLGPGDARHRRHATHPGRGPDHAGADVDRRLGDLHRDAEAASRPGGRVARADARPGAGADARRRLLGRPRRAPARPATRHR